MKTLSLVFWCVAFPIGAAVTLNLGVLAAIVMVAVAAFIAACE